jgi:hypothetical protein
MTPKSIRESLTIAASGVIVALTAAAFWLSYAHLRSVAATYGLATSPARAWAWPATLDLFIVAGELLLLRASLTGRTDWWAIGLTVTGSGGSIALNISGVGAHAHTLDYVVAAVPPTAALLAFGALMRQVHDALAAPDVRTVRETTAPDAPPAVTAGPVGVTEPDAVSAPAQPATAPPAKAVTPPRPAAATAQGPSRVRQTPGAGRTSRPARTDDELLAHLRDLRTGAPAPLSQRQVLAALGIGVPRLRALLDAHGLSLDPLPAPARPLSLVTADDQQRADGSAGAL